MRNRLRWACGPSCGLIALVLSAGCGLFEDATTITVDTDWQQLVLDADALGFETSSVAVPAIDCSSAPGLCSDATAQFSCGGVKYSCGLQCGDKGSCEVVAGAQESIEVNISKQLQGKTSADALQKVELDRIVFNTEENTLNFATPKITFFVGPQGAKLASDSGVTVFTRIDPIPAGTIVNKELDVDAEGQGALARFVKDYKTPFRFLAQAEMVFGAGQTLPKGKLKMKLKAYFEVQPLN